MDNSMTDTVALGRSLAGIPLTNGSFWELTLRFLLDLIIAFAVIRLGYVRTQRDANYTFTFFLFNVLIFFVCYLLSNVTLTIGFAFGLFAVFAILRYRTKPIPIKEMTYLFVVITIGVLNALTTPDIGLVELLFVNFAIIVAIILGEQFWERNHLSSLTLVFHDMDLLHPDRRAELLQVLREQTGLQVVHIRIRWLDLHRGLARLRVRYHS